MVEKAPSECVFVNLHTRDLLDEQLFSADAPLSKVAKRVAPRSPSGWPWTTFPTAGSESFDCENSAFAWRL